MLWDVAIIGGGPAGSASAISLRQTFPALSVLIVESSDYSDQRVGEVLPPVARPLLQHLGVLSSLCAEFSIPAHGLACAWGQAQLQETDYFYAAKGGGWHLERNRFDALLASHAELAGAEVWRKTSLRSATRTGDVWQLQLSGGREAQARWVIDATGRNATFARMQGVIRQAKDSLTAFSRIYSNRDNAEIRTVVEACPHGWWYTSPLPDGKRVVSFLTDADIGRNLGVSELSRWDKQLDRSVHVSLLAAKRFSLPGMMVRSAASVALDCAHADGWLATGDAAAAFDPLSAQGITSALRSGILASYAVGDALCRNDGLAAARYAAILRVQGESYARAHRKHYAMERRWSEYPFWARRQRREAIPLTMPSVEYAAALQGTL